MQKLSVNILIGLSLSPQVEMKFDSQNKNPANGNDFCYNAFGSCARQRHKKFKALLQFGCDFLIGVGFTGYLTANNALNSLCICIADDSNAL